MSLAGAAAGLARLVRGFDGGVQEQITGVVAILKRHQSRVVGAEVLLDAVRIPAGHHRWNRTRQ